MKAVLLILLITCSLAADYYEILGVSPEAGEHEIRKAFRKLSVQFHPDKNPGDKKAHQKYLEINKAYEILSDSDKKQIYDLYGEEGLTDQYALWRNKQKGPNASAEIRVTLEELYNGTEKDFQLNKKVICKKCKGTGSKDGSLKVCKQCNGRGSVMQNVNMGIGFNLQMQVPCDRCGGKGKTSSGNCPGCKGSRVLGQQKNLKIEIEKGMYHGQNIVFKGESEQNPDYMPGDLIFTLVQETHPFFTRKGDDLHMDLKITLKESILGFKKRVKHLDGHFVEIESSQVVQPFQVKQIKEEGMPIHNFPSTKGDLYVRFIVELPKSLSANEKLLLKQLFESQ